MPSLDASTAFLSLFLADDLPSHAILPPLSLTPSADLFSPPLDLPSPSLTSPISLPSSPSVSVAFVLIVVLFSSPLRVSLPPLLGSPIKKINDGLHSHLGLLADSLLSISEIGESLGFRSSVGAEWSCWVVEFKVIAADWRKLQRMICAGLV